MVHFKPFSTFKEGTNLPNSPTGLLPLTPPMEQEQCTLLESVRMHSSKLQSGSSRNWVRETDMELLVSSGHTGAPSNLLLFCTAIVAQVIFQKKFLCRLLVCLCSFAQGILPRFPISAVITYIDHYLFLPTKCKVAGNIGLLPC